MRSFLILIVVWLPAFAAGAQSRESNTLHFFERVEIGRDGAKHIFASEALLEHDSQEEDRPAVLHQTTVMSVKAKLSELGALSFDFVGDGSPDAAFRYARSNGIEWLKPQPTPLYVPELNRIIASRTQTDLSSEAAWSIRSRMAIPNIDLPLDFTVEPFQVNGRFYAVVHFEFETSEFQAGSVQGTARGHGFFVVSADFRDLYYYSSVYSGKLPLDRAAYPFSVKRGLASLDDDGELALSPEDLPSTLDIAGDIQSLSTDRLSITRAKTASTPDSLYGVAHALAEAFDAQIGVEAENRGNPVFLVVVAGIAVFNTVDGMATWGVNIAGRTLGNEDMTNFEGIGNTAARAIGELAGSAVKIVFKDVDKKAWGEKATKIWEVTGLAADGIMILTPGGAVGVLTKVGGKIAYVGKFAELLAKDPVEIAGVSMEIINTCSGAIFDKSERAEKRQDCIKTAITALIKHITKKKTKLSEKTLEKVLASIDWVSGVVDIAFEGKDEAGSKSETEGKTTTTGDTSTNPSKPRRRSELQHAAPLVWPSSK